MAGFAILWRGGEVGFRLWIVICTSPFNGCSGLFVVIVVATGLFPLLHAGSVRTTTYRLNPCSAYCAVSLLLLLTDFIVVAVFIVILVVTDTPATTRLSHSLYFIYGPILD